jgi:hypothetical protein
MAAGPAGCGRAGTAVDDPAASVDTIGTAVILSIGGAEGSDTVVVGRVFSGFLRDDRLFIANGMVPEVREYDLAGGLIRKIGRRGRGPGEFRNLRFIAPLGRDSLVALDLMSRQVSVFDSAGNHARSFTLPLPEFGQAEWISEYRDGFILGYSHGVDPRGRPGLARDSVTLAVIPRDPDPDGLLSVILPSVGDRWWEVPAPGRVNRVVDGPSPSFANRSDTVIATSSVRHAVMRWDGTGWEEIRLRGHLWQNGTVPNLDIPVRVYDQVVAGPGGSFWLSDYKLGRDGRRTWRIFDATGELRGVMRLDAGLRIWQAYDGKLFGRRVDDDGVEYIELIQLGTLPVLGALR